MKAFFFISLYLILFCSAQRHSDTYRNEISEMKKELALAQKKLLKQKAYIQQLEEEIAHGEITLIQKEVSQIEKHEIVRNIFSHEQWLSFFHQQRETLNYIIRNNPSCRSEAQEVLDKILILITRLSDQIYD